MLKIISLLLVLLISGNANAEQGAQQGAAQTTLLSTKHARALIGQGRDNDAISTLVQLLKNTPDDFQSWFLLGVTQARLRRFHDAVISFGKVAALQPTLAEPHNNLAVIYNELGDFRAAVKELEASLKLRPNYATAHENIGDLYVKLAADAYRKALKEDANPALRQRYDRLLHIRKGHTPKAATGARPVLTIMPTTAHNPGAEQNQVLAESKTAFESKAVDTIHQLSRGQANTEIKHPQARSAQQVLDTQGDIKAAMAAVEVWRSAWNRQDLPAYFAAYSRAFDVGTRFKTLQQWQQYKQRVITKRSFIKVTLGHIEAKKLANGEIRLVFLQHFRSDAFNSDDMKEVLLRQSRDGWKIIHEASSPDHS